MCQWWRCPVDCCGRWCIYSRLGDGIEGMFSRVVNMQCTAAWVRLMLHSQFFSDRNGRLKWWRSFVLPSCPRGAFDMPNCGMQRNKDRPVEVGRRAPTARAQNCTHVFVKNAITSVDSRLSPAQSPRRSYVLLEWMAPWDGFRKVCVLEAGGVFCAVFELVGLAHFFALGVWLQVVYAFGQRKVQTLRMYDRNRLFFVTSSVSYGDTQARFYLLQLTCTCSAFLHSMTRLLYCCLVHFLICHAFGILSYGSTLSRGSVLYRAVLVCLCFSVEYQSRCQEAVHATAP